MNEELSHFNEIEKEHGEITDIRCPHCNEPMEYFFSGKEPDDYVDIYKCPSCGYEEKL